MLCHAFGMQVKDIPKHWMTLLSLPFRTSDVTVIITYTSNLISSTRRERLQLGRISDEYSCDA